MDRCGAVDAVRERVRRPRRRGRRPVNPGADDPQARLALASWRLTQANAAYGDGPAEPVVNALDLVTLAALSRIVIEEGRLMPRFPEARQPLLATTASSKKRPGRSATSPDSETDRRFSRDPRQMATATSHRQDGCLIHFLDFAKQIGHPEPGETRAPRVVRNARYRPLAGLDPAMRKIEQTRTFADGRSTTCSASVRG